MAQRLIGIIDYGMGNIKSVRNALTYLGENTEIVTSAEEFEKYSHLILPGVGAFPQAIQNLISQKMVEPIRSYIGAGRPFLGICLGMQLLADKGEEIAPTRGLGIVPGCVQRLDVTLHVPHVGWNNLDIKQDHPIFEGIKRQVDFYFVHSYYFNPSNPQNCLAMTEYEKEFPAAVSNGRSAVAVQFHPEKSQDNGLKMLNNFCNWDGRFLC